MRITEAIAQADELYPNSYTREEKMRWCYELTAMLYEEYMKQYNTLEFDGGEYGGRLPPSVRPEDVESLYLDGIRQDKVDDRSFQDVDLTQGRVKIVYKFRPEPYAEPVYNGLCTIEGNAMTAPDAGFPLRRGDLLRMTYSDGTVEERYIMETAAGRCFFAADLPQTGEVHVQLKRLLTANVPVPPAYAGMYISYILGKLAFYQNDLEEYNKQMTAFDQTLDSFAKWYKQTNPVEAGVRFRRKW